MPYLSDEEIDRRLGITNTPKLAQIIPDNQYSYKPVIKAVPMDENESDFVPGVQRGLQNLQASLYGAGALTGSGLKKLGAENIGQKLQDVGMEGYRQNIEEAAQYPKKHSFKDVYTGKAGVGGSVDWLQGTIGELVPSMAEAAIGAIAGSAIAGPGVGTAVGGLTGRTILKKGIDQAVKAGMKKGIKGVSEAALRKQVTKQAMKKLGGKVGIGAAVMPMESGGMYGELLESHGIDAPETALLFGSLATSLEFFGGNSKLVDLFVDSLAKGSTGIAKRSAKAILSNIPEEALQEGGQEIFNILNTVVNTDEKLLTAENVEQVIESMAAGAVGGGVGAITTTLAGGKESSEEKKNKQIDQQVQNIMSGGSENVLAANEKLSKDLNNINTLLKEPDALAAEAEKQDISVEDLTVDLNTQAAHLIEVQNRLQKETGLSVDQESADEQIAKTDINLNPSDPQKEKGNYKKAPIKINGLDIKIENPAGSIRSGKDKDGNEWSSQMNGHYGYFARTEGKDGDQVDTIIKPGTTSSPLVYIVDQVDPKTGKFDEHKVIMGVNSAQEAKELYMSNYEEGWQGFSAIEEMEQTEFKAWLKDGKRTKQPVTSTSDKDIKNQQFDKLWYDYKQNDITFDQLKNRLKSQFSLTGGEINDQITYRKNRINEQQRKEDQQVEIDRLWDEYNQPDRSAEARENIQQRLDSLYWPVEQEADEVHNRKIQHLLELAKTPEEKDIAHTAIRNFYGRGQQIKTPTEETSGEPTLIDTPEIPIIGKQEPTFLDRATERLGGKVEPTIIYNKEKYAREVLASEADKASTFINEPQDGSAPQFETRETQTPGQGLTVENIKEIFPGQEIFIGDKKQISVRLKNGQSITFENIQDAGKEYIEYAMQTGQMSKEGKILGITLANKILLDKDFADNKTLWHENKHALDNLGIVTKADDSALNREFNKLRKANKLDFALSTHEDPIQAMIENRANMFAQIMVNRAAYRNNSTLNKLIQKAMDFFNQIYTLGRRVVDKNFQSVRSLARETESGKIYERTVDDQIEQISDPQFLSIPIDEANLPKQVKAILNLPAWKKVKDNNQLYRNKEFFDKTGFWIGKDGKWRYEIDPEKLNYDPNGFTWKNDKIPLIDKSKLIPISYIINIKDLVLRVPEIIELGIQIDPKLDFEGDYLPETNIISLKNRQDKETFFHELQHVINESLGAFAGSSVVEEGRKAENELVLNRLKEIKTKVKDTEVINKINRNIKLLKNNLTDYENTANWLVKQMAPYFAANKEDKAANLAKFPIGKFDVYARYETNPGEMEARLTEKRLAMSNVQRKAEPPWETLDKMLVQENLKSPSRVGNPDPGQALFETREPLPEQTISDKKYGQIIEQKNNLVKKTAQSLRIKVSAIKLMAERSLTPISTRLKIIGLGDLSHTLRQLDFRTAMNITEALKAAHPMMKRMKRNDVSKDDRITWDWARKNSDLGKMTQIARKYGFEENYHALREVLNKIRQEAVDVGLNVGYIEDYWPRVLKDQEGFLQATQGISRRADFSEAIKKKADSLGITVAQMNAKYPDLKADIISNLILGRPEGMGGPSATQTRVFEEIPDEYAEFYDDSDTALMQYIYSMTKKIEARRFFGKVPQRIANIKRKRDATQTELNKLIQLAALENSEPALDENKQKLIDAHNERIDLLQSNLTDYEAKLADYKQNSRDYTENIGVYINDLMLAGKLHKKDEKAVKDILEARFHERGTTGPVHWYKNLAYIDVLGNPIAALTQIGDMAWAMYVGEVWNPLKLPTNIKNFTKALFKKSNITKEDLGIERMAQEFTDFDSLSRMVSKVFKGVGLERIDSIGKEFLINNAFDAYKQQASTEKGRDKLLKKIRPIFSNESNKIINELLALDKDSTVEPSENIKMLLYSRLLDFQPMALSEMPEYYLNGGNWRILYMLKTYTIKQLDVFRNEVLQDLKHGDIPQKLNAIKNMTALMGVLALANAGADEIKDFMLGKETKLSDEIIENFLTIGGANRHVRMQARREGIGTAIGQMVLPPFKFVNSAGKDVMDMVEGEFEPKKSRFLASIPFIGKLAYWNVGRGKEYRPSIEEQEFSKAGKGFRKFKKDFDKANDKRLFLQANMEKFKQLKIYENFQKSIRKITARINQLKKLKQSTNVRTLIGQLEATQKQFQQRYFDLETK